MVNKIGGRKFVMAVLGITLCLIWAVAKLEKEYLVLALGFVSIYTVGNVTQKFNGETKE